MGEKLFAESGLEKDPIVRAIKRHHSGLIKYGYSNPQSLSEHVIFNNTAKDYSHPFSAKSFGYTFGSREYNKILPLKDFLSLPIDIVDDLLEGVAEGDTYVLKERQKAADKAMKENKNGSHNVNKILEQELKNV